MLCQSGPASTRRANQLSTAVRRNAEKRSGFLRLRREKRCRLTNCPWGVRSRLLSRCFGPPLEAPLAVLQLSCRNFVLHNSRPQADTGRILIRPGMRVSNGKNFLSWTKNKAYARFRLSHPSRELLGQLVSYRPALTVGGFLIASDFRQELFGLPLSRSC